MFFVMKMLMMNMEEVRDNSIEVSLPKQMVRISEDADNFDSAIQRNRGDNCSKASVSDCKVCTQKLILHVHCCARADEFNTDHVTTDSLYCDEARTPRTPSLVGDEVADLDSNMVKADEYVAEQVCFSAKVFCNSVARSAEIFHFYLCESLTYCFHLKTLQIGEFISNSIHHSKVFLFRG
jgi:hypothetical protein